MHNRRMLPILLSAVLLSALTLMLCSVVLGIGRYDAVSLQTSGAEVLPDHTVRITVPMPGEARREHMVFCFRSYNSVVRVLDGETLLLISGADRVEAGRPIGHMLLAVPVPEAAWGRELTVLAAAQDAERCAVLFFDANGLKKANDEFGHAAGDTMLREVGQALARAMEGFAGFFGRYGGDEFAACVPAAQVEETRRRFYRELDRVNREQRLPFPVSVACGIAAWGDYPGRPDMSMRTLIRLADEKMYRNKQEMKACRQA